MVDGLVRGFVKGVLDRFDEVQEGKMLPWQASDLDKQSCEKTAVIFVGGDEDYETVGAWNEDGLPSVIVVKFGQDTPTLRDVNPSGAVTQFFAILTHLIYQAVKRFLKSKDGDAMQKDIDIIVHSAVLALLGVESGFDKLYEVAE